MQCFFISQFSTKNDFSNEKAPFFVENHVESVENIF